MCRSHDQGHRRCKGSAATKARESLRKSINYQAKKAGLSVEEWKEQNPDLLELIKNTYDERLHRFEKQFGNENCEEEPKKMGVAETIAHIKAQKPHAKSLKEAIAQIKADEAAGFTVKDAKPTFAEKLQALKDKKAQMKELGIEPEQPKVPSEKKKTSFADLSVHSYMALHDETPLPSLEPEGYIDGDGEILVTGVQTPAEAAKKFPISEYGFYTKGENRAENSYEDLSEYMKKTEEYTQNLNLDNNQKHAVLCYSNDMYRALNKYFLRDDVMSSGIFGDSSPSWRESEDGYQARFKDEKDLLDFAENLDTALAHRSKEARIIYRGMGVNNTSQSMLRANNGESVDSTADRKKIMEQIYTPGNELSFDAYSSASDSINVAAGWSNSHSTWEDAGTGVLFEIKSSAGIPIAHISGHEDEREILLPRGLKFKVANSYWNGDTEEDCYKYNSTHSKSHVMHAQNKNTLIVQLIEVDDNGDEVTNLTKHEAPSLVARSELTKKEDS